MTNSAVEKKRRRRSRELLSVRGSLRRFADSFSQLWISKPKMHFSKPKDKMISLVARYSRIFFGKAILLEVGSNEGSQLPRNTCSFPYSPLLQSIYSALQNSRA